MLRMITSVLFAMCLSATAAWMPPSADAGCVVNIIPTNYSFIGRCNRDEVVTEVWMDPYRVRCGRVQVLCRNSKGEAGEAVEEPIDSHRNP